MKYLTLILSMILLQGFVSSAFSQRQRIDGDWNSPKCVEAVWQWTNPTEEEKK